METEEVFRLPIPNDFRLLIRYIHSGSLSYQPTATLLFHYFALLFFSAKFRRQKPVSRYVIMHNLHVTMLWYFVYVPTHDIQR